MRTSALPLLVLMVSGCSAPKDKPTLPTNVLGSCTYTNKFAGGQECREYVGSWTEEAATKDCTNQKAPTFAWGESCTQDVRVGWCLINKPGAEMRVGFLSASCGDAKTGCEVFAGGYYEAGTACGGSAIDDSVSSIPVFQQPERVCKAPLPGEPEGQSEGGQVCTWQAVSGCTEENRRFSDYADCSVIISQRPYYPAPEDARKAQPDERMNDAAYLAELGWVKKQVLSSSCSCCHGKDAPSGASNWDIDTEGNFANGFHDRGVAMGAGWIRSVGFGAYPPAENNGFHRPTPEQPDGTIFPSTDPERMRQFWLAEATRRGMAEADWAADVASPLESQLAYVPTACGDTEGMAADGTLKWRYGKVRYLYVLEAGSISPGVPPNLDLPKGTLWRLDVPSRGGTPLENGTVKYGVVPAGQVQTFPADGAAPAPLQGGKQYYLYALTDVAQPVTRCLFTAP